MVMLINAILIIILIVIWSIFYVRNIKNKPIALKNKVLIALMILVFNAGSLYFFNITNKKAYFLEFKHIEIALNLKNIEYFIKDYKVKYGETVKKDAIDFASDALLRHQFHYNEKSKNKVVIQVSDSITRDYKDRVYLLRFLLSYPYKKEQKEVETYVIVDTKDLTYEKIIQIYENTINELLDGIFFNLGLKHKTTEELVTMLENRFNMPDIQYTMVFNRLLTLENPPALSTKALLRFLGNPSTFSEATGYAILTNNCETIAEIINKSLYFELKQLETLFSILVQSKCEVVPNYLSVIQSSHHTAVADLAKRYLKSYQNNKKTEFTYKNGKKVEVE